MANTSLLKQNFHQGNSSATALKIPGMAIESGWCGGLMPAGWDEGSPATWALSCVNTGATRSQILIGDVKQEHTIASSPANTLNSGANQQQNDRGSRWCAL